MVVLRSVYDGGVFGFDVRAKQQELFTTFELPLFSAGARLPLEGENVKKFRIDAQAFYKVSYEVEAESEEAREKAIRYGIGMTLKEEAGQ